jgi:hypothetical protein
VTFFISEFAAGGTYKRQRFRQRRTMPHSVPITYSCYQRAGQHDSQNGDKSAHALLNPAKKLPSRLRCAPDGTIITSQFWRAEVILTRKNSDKITRKIIEL